MGGPLDDGDATAALIRSVNTNGVVACVGTALRRGDGIPAIWQLVARVLDAVRDRLPEEYEALLADRAKAEARDVLEVLASVVGDARVKELIAANIATVEDDVAASVVRQLARWPVRRCLSLRFDDVVERAFADRDPIVLEGRLGELDAAPQRLFGPDTSVVVKLFGDASDVSGLRLSSEDLATLVRTEPVFARTVGSLVSGRSMLFLGVSPAEMGDVLSSFADLADARQDRTHFAFVERSGAPATLAMRKVLLRYNIRPIWVSDADDIVRRLAQFADRSGGVRAVTPDRSPGPRLRALRLVNIGPFSKAALDFDAGWNVVLGVNGTGKSTILQSIALALAGPEGVPDATFLRRLLRSDQNAGSIEIDVNDETYRVALFRQPDGSVYGQGSQISLLARGTWLVTAFPALRGASVGMGRRAAQGGVGYRRPRIEDIEPMLIDDVDLRLDDVQHWLLEADARTQLPVMEEFFGFFEPFFADLGLTSVGAAHSGNEVVVRGADVEIPVRHASQGLSALLAWLGYVIQRLRDVYGKRWKDAAALVLVDELDAHAHPAWQREIVPFVRERLPNLQVIATTHSPLVVGSLSRQNLWVSRRAETVTLERPDQDPSGLRVDQILTTSAFGLVSTRSPETAEQMKEYESLAMRRGTGSYDAQRADELSREIARYQYGGETPREREVERRRRVELDDRRDSEIARYISGDLTDEERAAVLRALSEER